MANPEHVEILKGGIQSISDWRKAHPATQLDLRGAQLSGIDLRGQKPDWDSSSTLVFSRIQSSKRSLPRRLIEVLPEWNGANLALADLRNATLTNSDMSFANLLGAKLAGADCRWAVLNGAFLDFADMSSAQLYSTDLSYATLTHANLEGAQILSANLSYSDMTHASLRGAFLYGSIFRSTRLSGTSFSAASLAGTVFADVDLSDAMNLDEINDEFPFTIGFDTLWKFKGRIPVDFLRSAGVAEDLITFLPSLLGNASPIEFYSCFISYSHKDEEFCKRLHARMRDEKMRVWYAPEDMPGGKKLHEEIDRAIRTHDKLLLVLSKHSMKSEWVKTEVYKARMREKREGRRVLFPIRLVPFEAIQEWEAFNADDGKDMAREVREYLIPDFTKWKDHDSFEIAFGRLLRDLRAAGE